MDPQPTQPQSPQSPFPLFLILPTILFFASSLFLAYQNRQFRKEITALRITPTPTVSPLPDPTANWNTFTSKVYSFSFKYPSTWSINTPSPSGNFETDGILHLYTMKDGPVSFELEVMPLRNTAHQLQLLSIENYGWDKSYKKSSMLIDGSEATIYSGTVDDKPKGVAIIAVNNFIYKLSSVVWNDLDNLAQILSTFKFIDPTCPATCPQLMPPAPHFCLNGTIVSGKTNSCGCPLGPECQLNNAR